MAAIVEGSTLPACQPGSVSSLDTLPHPGGPVSSGQIAAWLRARIVAGEFRPGEDPLPSEKDLQEMFEVSRDTARRAVSALRDEGLVITVPQRGTYVVPEVERPERG